MNWLLGKGMSNIYSKVTIEKKWCTQNFNFLSLKSLSPDQFLGSSSSCRLLLNFQTSCFNLKIRGLGAKLCKAFLSIILILKGIMTFQSTRFVLNKNINISKNETESKMEKPTHTFREMNLLIQLV